MRVYVCSHSPRGCNDWSRRLLFHSRQVRTYSSQRPAKPGDTLTANASLHHDCISAARTFGGYSFQMEKSEQLCALISFDNLDKTPPIE